MTFGIIVARFQHYELTIAHQYLLNEAYEHSDKIIIALGDTGLPINERNPLTYEERVLMVKSQVAMKLQIPIEDIIFERVIDKKEDAEWSKSLDDIIKKHLKENDDAVLFGGRDSFSQYYSGEFDYYEIDEMPGVSASSLREDLLNDTGGLLVSREVMKGRLQAFASMFPTVYSTVDAVVIDSKEDKILLGRKPGETMYRLIGGFVEPRHESLIDAVGQELMEEAPGMVLSEEVLFLGNFKIDDWRYRNTPHCIFTNVFLFEYLNGTPVASDDIEEVTWFSISELDGIEIVQSHKEILYAIINRANQLSDD